MQTFDRRRSIVAAMSIGIARASYEYTLNIVRHDYPIIEGYYRLATEVLVEVEQDIAVTRILKWKT